MGRRAVIALLMAPVLAGCGSSTELPPPAEPGRSPPPSRPPAGRVTTVGTGPEGLVADAETGLVAVALRTPPALAVVEGASGVVVRRVPLPASSRHLQPAGPAGRVLVPAERADALVEVDLSDGTRHTTAVGRFPHDATAAGPRRFVGEERGDTISVVEGGRVVDRFRTARGPGGLVALGAGSRVAVVAVRERVVEAYDARTLRRVGRAGAGVGPTHVASDGRELLYVVDTQGDALLVFHLRPRLELTRRVLLRGAPYGIAFDSRRRRLWVTLTERNRVVELSAGGRPRPLRELPTVRQPNTVAVDSHSGRLFVASRSDGTLQRIDP